MLFWFEDPYSMLTLLNVLCILISMPLYSSVLTPTVCSSYFSRGEYINFAVFNFPRFNFAGFNFTGLTFAGFNFAGFRFAGFNFDGFHFAGFKLAGFNFAGFNFARFKLAGFNFAGLKAICAVFQIHYNNYPNRLPMYDKLHLLVL